MLGNDSRSTRYCVKSREGCRFGGAEGAEENDIKYTTLSPDNYRELSTKEILWWMANYIVPFEEIESYSLEFSGMLGDLGLYIPIVVLLSLNGQIDLGTTLVTTGLSNIITSLFFKVPMCTADEKHRYRGFN